MELFPFAVLVAVSVAASFSLVAAAHAGAPVDGTGRIEQAAVWRMAYLDQAATRFDGRAISNGMGVLDASGNGELFLYVRTESPSGSYQALRFDASGFYVPAPGQVEMVVVTGRFECGIEGDVVTSPIEIVTLRNGGDGTFTLSPLGVVDTSIELRSTGGAESYTDGHTSTDSSADASFDASRDAYTPLDAYTDDATPSSSLPPRTAETVDSENTVSAGR